MGKKPTMLNSSIKTRTRTPEVGTRNSLCYACSQQHPCNIGNPRKAPPPQPPPCPSPMPPDFRQPCRRHNLVQMFITAMQEKEEVSRKSLPPSSTTNLPPTRPSVLQTASTKFRAPPPGPPMEKPLSEITLPKHPIQILHLFRRKSLHNKHSQPISPIFHLPIAIPSSHASKAHPEKERKNPKKKKKNIPSNP